ncbi:MAG: Bug family tripartite tricarboxylate transporter substrate binding protein [Comamonas sp.]
MSFSPMNRRGALRTVAALGGGGLWGGAWAQADKAAWPARPVRLVVPYNAGGATDAVARVIAEVLSKRIAQPVVVDNKGGAGGILGTDTVAKAQPDGHTLLLSLSTSMLINQFLYTKLPYNPQKDLTLLSQVATAPIVLAVNPSVPAGNMKELLAYIKANRGKLSYGSWGAGSQAHLSGSYMSKAMDAEMTHVAYKGESPMLQDLVGGQLQLCFASALSTKPFLDAGRLKAIGVTGRQRMTILPQVPTIHEQGVQDDAYTITGWVGMAGPAGMPAALVEQIAAHLREVAKDAKVQERMVGAGFQLVMGSPQAFRESYQREMPVWKALVESAGAKLD